MEIYQISGNGSYQSLNYRNYDDIRILNDFLGKESYKDTWKPLKIYLNRRDYNKNLLLPVADCIDYSSRSLILSERAIEVLREYLEPTGELLPVEVYNKSKLNYTKLKNKYFAYNCLNTLNTIDKNNSKVSSLSDGTVISVEKYAFFYEKLKDQVIFKDNGVMKVACEIYCTDKFHNKIIENNLKGFTFTLLWSSEREVPYPPDWTYI